MISVSLENRPSAVHLHDHFFAELLHSWCIRLCDDDHWFWRCLPHQQDLEKIRRPKMSINKSAPTRSCFWMCHQDKCGSKLTQPWPEGRRGRAQQRTPASPEQFLFVYLFKVLHILAIEKPRAETKLFSQQKPPNNGSTCLLLWTSVLMFPNSTDTILCSSLWWRPWLHTSLNMACSYHNPYKVIYLYNFDHSEQKNA